MNNLVSWIHFGDLHISGRDEQNYRDFQTLIDEANQYMRSGIDFALLPGDNADDGEEDEYELVKAALSRFCLPVHSITGDHDIASGSVELFERYLSHPSYRSFVTGGYRFLLLNSVANWHPPVFGLGDRQMAWLRNELRRYGPTVVFMHAYPSEHGEEADELAVLFRTSGVLLVEMGHTHYNELGNDGRIIYAATRSTGQVEEGPPGFSVTTLDEGVVSWKFKPLGVWPLVMITSPADERLIVEPTGPEHIVQGCVRVRARGWGDAALRVTMSIDEGNAVQMEPAGACMWAGTWEAGKVANGAHTLTVAARTQDGREGEDRITVLVSHRGEYAPPACSAVDYENAFGAWPEKHILGTQLGPNENGRHWPSRRERESLQR